MTMTDNIVNFTKPMVRVPAHWRKHTDALKQMETEIDALRVRLEQERRAFLDVMQDDTSSKLGPDGRTVFLTEDERKAISWASWFLDKNVRDALALLECASERIGYATPADHDFEFKRSKSEPAA